MRESVSDAMDDNRVAGRAEYGPGRADVDGEEVSRRRVGHVEIRLECRPLRVVARDFT
jgi:hypothetical protein